MKSSNAFKDTIKTYLDQRAQNDELFAVSYAKPNKNLDECCTYILNEVQKSGCNGFHSDEIYSMAVHYYDEDDLKAGKPINARIVVDHIVELTPAEKEQARKDAIKRIQDEAYAEIKQKQAKPKKKVENVEQPSLFD